MVQGANRWHTWVILRWAVLLTEVDSWMVWRISCRAAGFGVHGISTGEVFGVYGKEVVVVEEEEGKWTKSRSSGANVALPIFSPLCIGVDLICHACPVSHWHTMCINLPQVLLMITDTRQERGVHFRYPVSQIYSRFSFCPRKFGQKQPTDGPSPAALKIAL